MESFLNFLWVVLALAALYLWRVRWAGQPRESSHAQWRQWTAFVCALILLFFTVSLTDDLHSELTVFEENAASRRHTTCAACPHHAPPMHAADPAFAIPVRATVVAGSSPRELLATKADFFFAPAIPVTLAGRAPPEFSV